MSKLADAIMRGLHSARPSDNGAGTTGRLYYETDTTTLFRDDGTGWESVEGASMANPMSQAGDMIYGGASGTPARRAKGSAGQKLTADGTDPVWADDDCAIEVIIGDGTNAITSGLKGFVEVPVGMTIESWRLVGDESGSIVIDIWKDTFANFPPTIADTITASAKPTLSTAQAAQDTTLTGWTTALAKGAWLAVNVDSSSTVKQVTLSLGCRKTATS